MDSPPPLNEKAGDWSDDARDAANPVVESAEWALKECNVVQINDAGVAAAASHIHARLVSESYTPRTWRTHPLHLCPPEPYEASDPRILAALHWLFFVSSLNFSFWSPREGQPDRYGVEWRTGWGRDDRTVWTGYWSLLAAVNRALEEGIPITDPAFYVNESLCPDSLLAHVFRPAERCAEPIPLLQERISILRQNGFILCAGFGGSFQGFIHEFHSRHGSAGTALQLVQMVTDTFPSFRDEVWLHGRRVVLWKRAQILAAETWAAFYPAGRAQAHPLLPGGVGQLTMFADYRVPQILHHLRILAYPAPLLQRLRARAPLAHGSREEVGIRVASVVAVERVRRAIGALRAARAQGRRGERLEEDADGEDEEEEISSVLIDFYLWDVAKRLERGEERMDGVQTDEVVPAHRTRSIWY
ncbi:hypothetical protein HETIRDRAFT_475396 [Heterobasidion irregulare TC 32-1]|uniref:Queuosine 5'-phosphate N-glycosylase/hydrolase n=1 Tax=Heterobasidion irregulare (strain TC 32-1) TaxID=747525 RepID=W4K7V0_HETIT|nr:uncharacterized protein HETIRDRAFT_475396 [Heterobasidion irregulare TC 32-1]ETW81863.1 hypothetical protein HETIRDRAFT_475396 [Heterobasidion irregulare TC 32-1]